MTGFSGFSISTLKLSPISFKLKGPDSTLLAKVLIKCQCSCGFIMTKTGLSPFQPFLTIWQVCAPASSCSRKVFRRLRRRREGSHSDLLPNGLEIPFKRCSGPMGIRQTMPIGMSRKYSTLSAYMSAASASVAAGSQRPDLMRVLSGDFSKTFSW